LDTASTTNWLNNRTLQTVFAQSSGADFRLGRRVGDLITVSVRVTRVPFWAMFATVMLAATAVCATVILSSQNQLRVASSEYQRMTSQIASLRQTNQRLEGDVRRITSDTSAIEVAARERLGMVRPTDVVVPIESQISTSSAGTVSFVR
jgi:cell division protein FtsL